LSKVSNVNTVKRIIRLSKKQKYVIRQLKIKYSKQLSLLKKLKRNFRREFLQSTLFSKINSEVGSTNLAGKVWEIFNQAKKEFYSSKRFKDLKEQILASRQGLIKLRVFKELVRKPIEDSNVFLKYAKKQKQFLLANNPFSSLTDVYYNSFWVAKFLSIIIQDGQKAKFENIFYSVAKIIKLYFNVNIALLLFKILILLKTTVSIKELKQYRKGISKKRIPPPIYLPVIIPQNKEYIIPLVLIRNELRLEIIPTAHWTSVLDVLFEVLSRYCLSSHTISHLPAVKLKYETQVIAINRRHSLHYAARFGAIKL
jgi:hypothetical protein